MKISVFNEIGKLKTVLLHRPSSEVENITPSTMERLLFDDIPYLKVIKEEHDAFADLLRSHGTEVLYLEKLLAQSLSSSSVKEQFLEEFITEADINNSYDRDAVKDYLSNIQDIDEFVLKLMSGVRKDIEVQLKKDSLNYIINKNYPFIADPIPNLYFTRDPFATIGNGISLNHMYSTTRNRETLFAKYIFKYHPLFKQEDIPFWYDRIENNSIEGGDIIVLNENTLCVGVSQRTNAGAVEKLAKNLFNGDSGYSKILAFKIPAERSFMHLDTVFTQINHSQFTVHGGIVGPLSVYEITGNKGGLSIHDKNESIDQILQPYCPEKVEIIYCGGGDKIIGSREQWNDGSNTLCIQPGEVIVYERNYVSNRILQDRGVITHEIKGSELSRGRGGPRCMSMPLIREKI